MSWFYLSFASEEGFLGACYVQGDDLLHAVKRAWVVGANPGGQVRAAGPIDEETMDKHVSVVLREKLLSPAELGPMAPWPED